MEKNNKEALIRQLIVVLIGAFILLFTTPFIWGCVRYEAASQKISSIEREANATSWTDELDEDYDKAVSEKEILIQESDVANWCYMSAETITGGFVRMIFILVAVVVWVVSIVAIVIIVGYDIKVLYKHRHKQKCRRR